MKVEFRTMRVAILTLFLLLAGASHGEVTQVPIRLGVVLQPNEGYTVIIEAPEPTEIFWRIAGTKRCSTNCVQATELTSPSHMAFTAAMGASKRYTPSSGKISIEYKNVSSEAVTIDVFRIRRTCDAEACKFLDNGAKSRWLVFKVGAFHAITTSKDGSYSLISGTTMSGRPFTVRAVWWTDDSKAFRFGCPGYIKGYVDRHTPADAYRPYILSGQAIGEGDHIVLKSVDDCVPRAPHFGAPDANVVQ